MFIDFSKDCDYFSFSFFFHEQAKQKQKGAQRMTLPSVEGQEGGKWIVIDSGLSPLYDVRYVGCYRKSKVRYVGPLMV